MNVDERSAMLTIPDFDKTNLIRHAFTTRLNNLGARANGIRRRDDWNSVADEFGIISSRLVTVNQVHGGTIIVVDEQNYAALGNSPADGMITRAPGMAIGIETADCVPVLLIDPDTPAVGAVHAGWRSTVELIVRKAVLDMQKLFGSDPSRMSAAIGPAIGPECYEVDEPVIGPIRERFPQWEEAAGARRNGRWSLDLAKLNRSELIKAGLDEHNVYSLGICTSCRRDLFYSFRAEGRTGRMLSAVMIQSGGSKNSVRHGT